MVSYCDSVRVENKEDLSKLKDFHNRWVNPFGGVLFHFSDEWSYPLLIECKSNSNVWEWKDGKYLQFTGCECTVDEFLDKVSVLEEIIIKRREIMSKFKVGDKVKLCEGSKYQGGAHQLRGIGTVKKIRVGATLPYTVFYGDRLEDTNRYADGDLILVEKESLKDSEPTITNEATTWTQKHYDCIYKLKPFEIESGEVRLDTYKVNKVWGLNKADETGAAFHCLKTLNRIPRQKNPLKRELIALIGQVKCWAREEDIDLSEYLK